MKKLFSTLLALVFVLSMGTIAMANGDTTTPEGNMGTITIKKQYKLTNPDTSSPAETFEFKIERTSVTDAGDGIVAELSDPVVVGEILMPLPTIGDVSYVKGEADTDVTTLRDIVVTLPMYSSVGIYTYTINEILGTNAGVTYFAGDITLVVTVTQGTSGLIATAAVHTENPVSPSYDEDSTKSDTFENEYSAGDLEFSKVVTGNLGDKAKYFDVTVTLTGVAGMTYDNPYPVTGGSNLANPGTIVVGTPTLFKIRDGETIKIANLPYGVTYTVVETDYTGEDYDEADYSEFDEEIDSALDTVVITNNKDTDVDTGISLDSIPYIMILGLAVLGISGLFLKRRKNANF